MKRVITLLIITLCVPAWVIAENIATLRGTPIDIEAEAPPIGTVENKDERRTRAYPMQPPTIPHKIDGYQVDKDSNKCMFCHSRKKATEMKAPMVSVTHYMNRDGNFLSEISPRRYFCTQCHVIQEDVKPLVENDFIDADSLIKQNQQKK